MKNISVLLIAVLMMCILPVSSHAELLDRGGGLIFDTVLNITWLQDANYAKSSGYDSDGVMDFATAKDWAANLQYNDSVRNVTWDDWRLPDTLKPDSSCDNYPTSSTGYNCEGGEMGHLYYVDGVTAFSPGLFTNVEDYEYYWSRTENAPSYVFIFKFANGYQSVDGTGPANVQLAWAVRDGDVGPAVPTLSCIGFEPPFDDAITLKKKNKRAIPIKMMLVDNQGDPITDENISAPPVVNVEYEPFSGVIDENSPELVPPGLADDGNAFRFDPTSEQWIINLSTKQFSSAGIYTVTVEPGDLNYLINTCTQMFIRPE